MSGTSMRLRYHGVCRECSTVLTAGTVAVYERSTRTVRCEACAGGAGAAGAAVEPEVAAPEPVAPGADADLGLRPPGAAVIAETLRLQAAAPPRSRLARIFGLSPLAAESTPWFRGGFGEQAVGQALEQLGEGWHVVHAIPISARGTDVDHLVVGPPGVFSINTKFHQGKRVWVGGRSILVSGQRVPHLRNSRHEGERVARMLSQAVGAPVTVQPVIAITAAASVTFKERPTDVVVLQSTSLTRWLRRGRPELAAAEVDALAAAMRNPQTWGVPVPADPDILAFARLRREVASARMTRGAWGVAAVATMLGISLALLPDSFLATFWGAFSVYF